MSYLLTIRGMFQSMCMNIVWRGHMFELVGFNKRAWRLLPSRVCVWLCIVVFERLCALAGGKKSSSSLRAGFIQWTCCSSQTFWFSSLTVTLYLHLTSSLNGHCSSLPLPAVPPHKKVTISQTFQCNRHPLENSSSCTVRVCSWAFLVKHNIF